MARQWKCARCGTPNDEGTLTCSNCRMIRGAVVVPGSFSQRVEPPAVDTEASAAEPPATIASGELAPTSWDGSGVRVAAPSASVPFWRRIPLGLVVVAVLVVGGGIVGYLSNANRSSSGEITKGGDLVVSDLRVGDCFDLKDASADQVGEVTAVPCGVAHEYEMYFVGAMADGVFPSDDAFDAFFENNCIDSFEAYVGRAYEASELDIFWLVPIEDGWNAGDRSVQCAVYHPQISRLTESLKGSGR
jgi:putative regulator of septum formation